MTFYDWRLSMDKTILGTVYSIDNRIESIILRGHTSAC